MGTVKWQKEEQRYVYIFYKHLLKYFLVQSDNLMKLF